MNFALSGEGILAIEQSATSNTIARLSYVSLDHGLEIDLRIHQSLQQPVQSILVHLCKLP